MHGHDPGLAELGATDRGQITIQRDIGLVERECFAA
jgi:hypothetical protein